MLGGSMFLKAAAAAALVVMFGCGGGSSFTDSRDGKKYKTVNIGNRTWMAENMNYKTSNGSWCYDNDESNCDKYGRLYDWEAAKAACPPGWHLPSNQEWNGLIETAGDNTAAGTKLKASNGWSNNGNGTDGLGFSALPGGYRNDYDGVFDSADSHGYWWTATDGNSGYAYNRSMYYDLEYVIENYNDKSGGYSVRCVVG